MGIDIRSFVIIIVLLTSKTHFNKKRWIKRKRSKKIRRTKRSTETSKHGIEEYENDARQIERLVGSIRRVG